MMFVINVEGAIFKEDKWLIIHRSSKEEHAGGMLSLVGGTAEKEGNSIDLLERTLRRELFEEVGVTAKGRLDYVMNTSFVLGDEREVMNVVFAGELDCGEPFAKAMEEVEAVYWMTAEEILNHPQSPVWLRDSVEKAEEIRLKLVSLHEGMK